MKTKSLASLLILSCSIAGLAAPLESDSPSRQLQIYPKNLARQHVGTNLFLFNAANQSYAPTEASAAWLDDDVTTGWPVMAGKQHYLVALSEPQLLTNFAISTRPVEGTVSLYASDEPAAPGAKGWALLAQDVPLESVNNKKLTKPFSRLAKYLLIETDIADPGPLFGLYVYGERSAVAYRLGKREQAIDTRSIFGPFVNNQTSFNTAALYSGGRITNASSPEGYLAWQKAIDENPESGVSIAPTTTTSGAVVKFDSHRSITRLALLTDESAKGRLDFFVVDQSARTAASESEPAAEIVQVSNPAAAPAADEVPAEATTLAGLTPTVSIVLEGTSPRTSIDLPATEGSTLLVRWTPEDNSSSLTIRELNSFSDLSLNENELSLTPEAIAELGSDPSKDGKSFKGDGKDGKPLEPIKDLRAGPYLPGSLGFPPNITGRVPSRVGRVPMSE